MNSYFSRHEVDKKGKVGEKTALVTLLGCFGVVTLVGLGQKELSGNKKTRRKQQ
jgi:hypothetical protein